jgi:thioester reductase-like protein
VFELESMLRLVCERGRLMGSLESAGAMAAVRASEARVREVLGEGLCGLSLAAENGPEETVLSGERGALERAMTLLEGAGQRAKRLAVSQGFHSGQMEPVLGRLEEAVRRAGPRPASGGLISDLSGEEAGAEVSEPGYWARHARQPVRFWRGLERVHEQGCRAYVEVGPGSVLLGLARGVLPEAGQAYVASVRRGRDEARELRRGLGELWVRGVPVGSVETGGGRPLDLPTYPFQRQRHWFVEAAAPARRQEEPPLVGRRVPSPLPYVLLETHVSPEQLPFLDEHRVGGVPVFPGVAYVQLLLSAAAAAGWDDPVLDDLQLTHPLVVAGPRTIQVVLGPPDADGSRPAHVHSQDGGDWQLHVAARLRPAGAGDPEPAALDAVRARCPDLLSGAAFYESVWHPDFQLGPSFRLLERVHRRDGEALALIRMPDAGARAVRDGVRPELLALDACVQALVAAARPDAAGAVLALGTGYERLRVRGAASTQRLWCHAVLRDGPADASEITGDLRVFTEAGDPVAELDGVRFRRISGETLGRLAASRPSGAGDGAVRRRLQDAEPARRRDVLAGYLAGELARVVGMEPAEVDRSAPVTAHTDSLMLVELKGCVERDLGVALPMTALFDSPTLDGLAGRLLDEFDGSPAGVTATMTVAELEAEATLDVEPRPRRTGPALRDVLLTGATGFVGAFLLAELLDRTDARVRCLVRADDEEGALARLRANLGRFGLDAVAADQRVEPVPGDLALPLLGLGADRFNALAAAVDTIYHGGALVKWTYPYVALRAPNVAGTHEVLRLAAAGGAPVHFVSTVGVFASAAVAGGCVREDQDLAGTGALAVGYAQTKWVAERMVTKARGLGMPVSIYRPSIGGDSRTGAFNPHDHVCLILKGCIQLGAAPDLDHPVQIAPVDFVARAIVELSRRGDPAGGTYHLVNPRAVTWSQLFDHVRSLGYSLDRLPFPEWREELQRRAGGPGGNALFGLLPLFSGSTLESSRLPVFDCAATLAGLAGTGVDCPPLDDELLGTYFRHFVESGFLEAPPVSSLPPRGGGGSATTRRGAAEDWQPSSSKRPPLRSAAGPPPPRGGRDIEWRMA